MNCGEGMPLVSAAERGHFWTTWVLLRRGADPRARRDGPLCLATTRAILGRLAAPPLGGQHAGPVIKDVKLDAQVLATALAVYVTDGTLDSTGVGTQYGFLVGGNGVATATYNVGSNGSAFGVADNTVMTVMDLLLAADAQAVNGVLYGGNTTERDRPTPSSALSTRPGVPLTGRSLRLAQVDRMRRGVGEPGHVPRSQGTLVPSARRVCPGRPYRATTAIREAEQVIPCASACRPMRSPAVLAASCRDAEAISGRPHRSALPPLRTARAGPSERGRLVGERPDPIGAPLREPVVTGTLPGDYFVSIRKGRMRSPKSLLPSSLKWSLSARNSSVRARPSPSTLTSKTST